jgi:oligopeptide/dipeptide ABC transporter ATP-binding protein
MFELRDLCRVFPVRSGSFNRVTGYLKAIDHVNLDIPSNRIIGIVGESGSGKTTLGRMLIKLLSPSSGMLNYCGRDIVKMSRQEEKVFRKEVQMLFQDPFLSLNPRRSVFDTLAQPLRIHRLADSMTMGNKVNGLLSQVGLEPAVAAAFPHELSGGVRQRVAFAAALSVNPRFIFCDEPVSVLDASARAQILNLMQNVQAERGLTLLIVSHDLTAVEYVCDDVAVMYLGTIVEYAPTQALFEGACHPYTDALIASMPERALDPGYDGCDVQLEGEIPSPVNLPLGCRFHTRCPKKIGAICVEKSPELLPLQSDHTVACHLFQPSISASQQKGRLS